MDIQKVAQHRTSRRTFIIGGAIAVTGVVTAGVLGLQYLSGASKPTQGVLQVNWNNVAIGGGGPVPGIILHPLQPDLIYIRSALGGVFRWDTTNRTWLPLLDWLSMNQDNLYGAESIAIDPTDPAGDTVYAALGTYAGINGMTPVNGTIARSTDRGTTWQLTNISGKIAPSSKWSQNYGERLVVDPNYGQYIYYASASTGLWRSTDGSNTWSQVGTAPTGDLTGKGQWGGSVGLTFVLIDTFSSTPGMPSKTMYLGVGNKGVYKSEDGSLTWKLLPDSPTNPNRAAIDGRGTIYVSHERGLAKFSNGTWTNITPTKEKDKEFVAIALNPLKDQHLITARHDKNYDNPIYHSEDGGKNWSLLKYQRQNTVPWWTSYFWSASTMSLAFDPYHQNRVFYTDRHGVWSTDDISASPSNWINYEHGHEDTITLALISPSKGAPLLSGIAYIDGFRHTSINNFPQTSFTDPLFEHTTGLDFQETDPTFVVRCASNTSSSPAGGGAYSVDNGATWQPFATTPKTTSSAGRIAVSASIQSLVWLPMGDIPYISHDKGKTWTASTGAPINTVPGEQIWTWNQPLAADRKDGNRFYLYDGNSGKFYRSNDGGATWTATSATLPTSLWHKVEVNFSTAHDIWISLDKQGLWRSTNGGDSFQQIPNVQRSYLHTFGVPAADQQTPALFVYGTVNQRPGIFISEDLGQTWSQLDTAQEAVGDNPVVMVGDRKLFSRVYIGTRGRGIFYTSLH